MSRSVVLDATGRRRSPATMPGFHAGRPPRNKGLRYPADPPTVEEIVAVMRIAGDGLHGWRLRGLVVVLWRAGLRIDEALALREADLDRRRGSILVRRGKGGRRREIGMDDWAGRNSSPGSLHGSPCRSVRCSASSTDAPAVARGPPVGHAASCDAPPCEPAFADASLPHQLRHAHAVEMAREGVPLVVIQRQLVHSNLGITSVYLQGIDNAEIIETVHARRAPMIPVTTSRPALPGASR
jgi:integrase